MHETSWVDDLSFRFFPTFIWLGYLLGKTFSNCDAGSQGDADSIQDVSSPDNACSPDMVSSPDALHCPEGMVGTDDVASPDQMTSPEVIYDDVPCESLLSPIEGKCIILI